MSTEPTTRTGRPPGDGSRAETTWTHAWGRILLSIGITLVGVVAVSWARQSSGDARLSSASYDVPWSAQGIGAGTSTSNNFRVDAVAGEEGGVPFRMIGNSYQVTSGYWSQIETGSHFVFWDFFESGNFQRWSQTVP